LRSQLARPKRIAYRHQHGAYVMSRQSIISGLFQPIVSRHHYL